LSVASNSRRASAGRFSSSSMSPSSSRAGSSRPGVTMFFSFRSSMSAAWRITASASSLLFCASATHAADASLITSTSFAQ